MTSNSDLTSQKIHQWLREPQQTVFDQYTRVCYPIRCQIQDMLDRHGCVSAHHLVITMQSKPDSYALPVSGSLEWFYHEAHDRITEILGDVALHETSEIHFDYIASSLQFRRSEFHILVYMDLEAYWEMGNEVEPARTVLVGCVSDAWEDLQACASLHPPGITSRITVNGEFLLSNHPESSGVIGLSMALRALRCQQWAGDVYSGVTRLP